MDRRTGPLRNDNKMLLLLIRQLLLECGGELWSKAFNWKRRRHTTRQIIESITFPCYLSSVLLKLNQKVGIKQPTDIIHQFLNPYNSMTLERCLAGENACWACVRTGVLIPSTHVSAEWACWLPCNHSMWDRETEFPEKAGELEKLGSGALGPSGRLIVCIQSLQHIIFGWYSLICFVYSDLLYMTLSLQGLIIWKIVI